MKRILVGVLALPLLAGTSFAASRLSDAQMDVVTAGLDIGVPVLGAGAIDGLLCNGCSNSSSSSSSDGGSTTGGLPGFVTVGIGGLMGPGLLQTGGPSASLTLLLLEVEASAVTAAATLPLTSP